MQINWAILWLDQLMAANVYLNWYLSFIAVIDR